MLTSFRNRSLDYFKPRWVTLLLAGGVIGSLLDSLATATWYRDAEPFVALALFGLAYGALLAVSKFSLRAVILISACASIGLTLIVIGRVVPAPPVLFTTPLSESIRLMNLRLFALFEQIGRGDLPLALTGFGLLVWQASVAFVWSILRSRRALMGVVWCTLPMVINLSASGKAVSLSLVFMISGVLLLARTAYLDRVHDWETRRVAYPELITEDWSLGVTLVAITTVCLGWSSTPEWRASLERFFNSLQPVVAVHPVVQQSSTSPAPLPLSFVPDVSVVGDPIPPDSNATLFWVRIDDPAPRIGAGGEPLPPDRMHYWRGGIFGAYTGRGWEPISLHDDVRSMPVTATVPPGRYALHQQFDIIALHGSQLFAANDPITASVAVRSVIADDSGLVQGFTSTYTVTSWAAAVTANQLQADLSTYPAAIQRTYLQVPDSVPQRVRDLARSLTAGATTAYDQAVRIQNYLRTTYRYRLDVPPPPGNRDIVDYFLFDAPGGFCSYYASALVVMLRTLGVPARIVTGYAMGDFVRDEQIYRVPASAAHAWVEVYFPTYGWIEFEPTASMTVFVYPADVAQPTAPEVAPASTPNVIIAISRDVIVIASVLVGLAALISASGFIRRQYLWRQRSAGQQARELYWQMRHMLIPLGVRAPASVTPVEFVTNYLQPLAARPQLIEIVRRVAASYIAATYTDQAPTREGMQALRRQWQRAWLDRLKMRWQR